VEAFEGYAAQRKERHAPFDKTLPSPPVAAEIVLRAAGRLHPVPGFYAPETMLPEAQSNVRGHVVSGDLL